MSYTIIEGSTIRFYTSMPFTSISGTVVNPDNVVFNYSVQGQNEVTYRWINPTGDSTGHIVQGSGGTGYFQCDVPTSGNPGTWVWQWGCYPSSGQDVTNTQVYTQGTVIVSASDL